LCGGKEIKARVHPPDNSIVKAFGQSWPPSIPTTEDRAFPEYNDCSGNAPARHKDRSLTAPGCCSARHGDRPLSPLRLRFAPDNWSVPVAPVSSAPAGRQRRRPLQPLGHYLPHSSNFLLSSFCFHGVGPYRHYLGTPKRTITS
jgi:hypothetical protein